MLKGFIPERSQLITRKLFFVDLRACRLHGQLWVAAILFSLDLRGVNSTLVGFCGEVRVLYAASKNVVKLIKGIEKW
jgi:hypothetical protein